MSAARFHNALRIMMNLGVTDLEVGKVIDGNWGTPEASNRDQVSAFMDDPFLESIRMPEANFERLVALVDSRQPEHLK